MRPTSKRAFWLGALLSAGAAFADPSLTVKYRSSTSVYLDGGKAQGLAVGDRLTVVEKGATVAELEVTYLAEQSASCRIVSERRPVRAGDVVTRLAKGPASATASPPASSPSLPLPAASPPPLPPSPGPRTRLHGGVSLGYSRTWDDTPAQLDFEQQTARVDLSLTDIAGQPLSFKLRLRSRQDQRERSLSSLQPSQERRDRLYEASLRYQPASDRYSVEAGRLGVSPFVGLGYLDGVLARVRLWSPLQVGAFAGRRAEIEGLGLQGSGAKYGAFLAFGPRRRYAPAAAEAVLGAVRETQAGEVSREYLSLESRLLRGSLSFFERAEIDWNRGWRGDLSDKSFQLSSLTASLAYRLTPSAQAVLSYDSHQNYRTQSNRTVPQALFDDLARQGLRGGLSFGGGRLLATAGAGVRFKDKTSAASAYSANLGLNASDLHGWRAGLDGIGFTNGYTKGAYASARLGRRFGPRLDSDLAYGASAYQVKSTDERRFTQWIRAVGRGNLGRGVLVTADLEYRQGDDLKGPRAFLELGWRF